MRQRGGSGRIKINKRGQLYQKGSRETIDGNIEKVGKCESAKA
ncbi:MAG: hypothetical protein AB1499_12195 [Nitrospirota bacterium]